MRKTLHSWQQHNRKLVGRPLFEHSIIGLILLNAMVLGLDTDATQ
ncbi:MAG: hypothetical protein U9P00_06185 [Pseudomonadota bacterium]|nr:hypothetical protein [Pseudomonadota bacterium]